MKKMKFYIASIILLMGLIVSCDNDDNADNTDPDLDEGISCIPDNFLGNLIAFYPFSGGSLNDFSGNNYYLSNPTTASPDMDWGGNLDCAYFFVASNGDFLTFFKCLASYGGNF